MDYSWVSQQSVPVTYPDNYPNAEIAGKAVEFALTVREIKQKVLPVLDDDFAKDHGEHALVRRIDERRFVGGLRTNSSIIRTKILKKKSSAV